MLNISMAAKTEISQTFNTGHSSCNSTSTVKISKMQGAKATDKMSFLRLCLSSLVFQQMAPRPETKKCTEIDFFDFDPWGLHS